MGLRILYDVKEDMAALYDSVSDWAFGPVFYRDPDDFTPADERAEKFVAWLPQDARVYDAPDLERLYGEWRAAGEPGGGDAPAGQV